MNRAFEELFERYPTLAGCSEDIQKAYDILVACYSSGGKLLICGNGGSAADASHIVGELMKGFLLRRELSDEEKSLFSSPELAGSLQGGLPAISLCVHDALMTAFANDCDSDSVFAQQVYAYSRKCGNDALLVLTTSGNSENIVRAAQTAAAIGIPCICITGADESRVSDIACVCIKLPATTTFKVQELTLPVYHALCAAIEEYFYH